MTNRELETRYMQMKLTWKNLVNANVELVDENKMLKEEIERLNNKWNEFEKWIDLAIEVFNNVDVKTLELVKRKLKELKGSDKE